MYPRAEIGYDTPEHIPGRVRPGKLARRLILALVIGVLAGAAIMLQIKGWTTLGSEAGGACGTSDQGVSYGACPRGITPALIISIFIGFVAVPRPSRCCSGRAGPGGAWSPSALRAGCSPGSRCSASGTAPTWPSPGSPRHDGSSQLTTVGAWASGDSLIRVRVDQAVSYDAATGAQRWTLTCPGQTWRAA